MLVNHSTFHIPHNNLPNPTTYMNHLLASCSKLSAPIRASRRGPHGFSRQTGHLGGWDSYTFTRSPATPLAAHFLTSDHYAKVWAGKFLLSQDRIYLAVAVLDPVSVPRPFKSTHDFFQEGDRRTVPTVPDSQVSSSISSGAQGSLSVRRSQLPYSSCYLPFDYYSPIAFLGALDLSIIYEGMSWTTEFLQARVRPSSPTLDDPTSLSFSSSLPRASSFPFIGT